MINILARCCLSGLILFCLGLSAVSANEQPPVLRIGTIKSGTLNWELDTIKRLKLDEKYGFTLEIVPSAGKSGILIGLLGDAIDIMVNDWLWLSNQRAKGLKLTGVPYSKAVGALIIQPHSTLDAIGDLSGKKIGIVGGPLDINWLLLQAALIEQGDVTVDSIESVYGAAPLISKKLEQGELDSALLFWHFAARLSVKGFPTLVDSATLMRNMGIPDVVPLLVYTFRETFADSQPDLFISFFKAVYEAKHTLLHSDEDWHYLRDSMNVSDDATYRALVSRWREGVPLRWNQQDIDHAGKIYGILYQMGGRELVKNPEISPGTFWSKFDLRHSLPAGRDH
jgi:NitT/TauT family transport system substrate-binding protein